MSEIRFSVRGVPVSQGSCRAYVCKGHAVVTNKNPRLNQWREAVSNEARAVAPEALLGGALQVSCCFRFEPPKSRKKQGMTMYSRPDIDKLLRAVLDACTGILWFDDAQVQILRGQKMYASPPGCDITVRQCPVTMHESP